MTEQLLAALQRRTNARGLVIAGEAGLLEELHVTRETLRAAVEALARGGTIEVLSALPFFIGKWSSSTPTAADAGPKPYSAIQLLQPQEHNSSYRRAGAHWPIDAALLQEILDTLGERDGKSFEKAVELYSPHIIRTALDRVRRAKGIRKSRTALFRHLLPRLARDEHRFDQLT